MKLSALKLGNFFKFEPDQQALYYSSKNFVDAEYTTMAHVIFEVIKRNPTSVLCRPFHSDITFCFKFSGLFAGNNRPGFDASIIICDELGNE